jgi:hypothetical protein
MDVQALIRYSISSLFVFVPSTYCTCLICSGGKPVRVPQSRKEKIEAELKLLEWHKMANAAAIKVRQDAQGPYVAFQV